MTVTRRSLEDGLLQESLLIEAEEARNADEHRIARRLDLAELVRVRLEGSQVRVDVGGAQGPRNAGGSSQQGSIV